MPSRVDARLADVPLRNVKAGLHEGEGTRRNPTPRGEVVNLARKAAGLEVKQMADDMGVSESFLLRGFKDQEHLSWQRIKSVQSPRFHQVFLELQAQDVPGVDVVTEIRIKRSA